MSEALERRYRRMLAWYPREHRAVYEQEMLGVLMEGAGSDRSRPTLSERVDLLRGAFGARLRRAGGALRHGPWPDAAAVAATVTLFLLLQRALEVAVFVIPTDPPWAISATIWAWLGTVTALALALALGWRVIAAVIGWPLLVAHLWSSEVPAPPWMVALVVVLAVSLTLSVRSRGARAVIGGRPLALMAVAMGLAPVAYAVVSWEPANRVAVILMRLGLIGLLLLGPVACAVVVVRLDDRQVRRRAVALLVPVAIGMAMHLSVLPTRFANNIYFLLLEYLPFSIVDKVNTALPVLGFLVALAVVRLRERSSVHPAETGL